ncbi:MAG TPA: protein kinase [Kofleriaceae bacterium]|nr:protein kinase [Kofleriaceae bacterium]
MEQFGKYQLLRRIGIGGMAEVFLARTSVAQGLSKQLVIKKIHPAFARSRQFAAMFVDEARIALGLNHPNIVQVFDFGQLGENYFLAMEYVEGFDLLRVMQEVSRRRAMVPLGLCAYIVQQVAKGLDYAHRKTDDFGEPLGIVHRDVSPQNVLLSHDGAVKIVDFGIARAIDMQEEEGVVKGKFAYMAPEQARGEIVDRRADVYSAGVVLFELATGRPMFPGKGKDVLVQVKEGAVPRPRDFNREIPHELEEIILRAIAFDPGDRFQTGRDLQNALGRFQFELARQTGDLFDSGALAQFLAGALPPSERRTSQQLPTSPPPGSEPVARGTEPQRRRARDSSIPPFSGGLVSATPSSPSISGEPARETRERKHVLVLEGHIAGAAALERRLGRREALRILHQFLAVARDIAFKYEAHVHRMDEAGLTCVVGLPVASEEDASRAIRLALGLIDALDAIGLDVEPDLRLAAGVQRGVALIRRNAEARSGFELSAASTGMARRLATEAEGGDILCGGEVARVAQDDWNFEELATIELPAGAAADGETDGDPGTRGQRARVYRVRGPKERVQRLRERGRAGGELVGRELELKAMRDAYRDVLVRGGSRHVVVLGEAGVGKGALIGAFLDTIPAGQAVFLHGAARAATYLTPLGLLADLGRDLLGLAEGAEPREVIRRLETAARLFYFAPGDEAEIPAVVRATAPLFGARVEDAPDMDADERRERIKQVMVRVERNFSVDRPLVIITEDAHWADDQSMELFREHLALRATRPLLVVFTSRPDRRVLELARVARAEIIRLEELDQAARMELILRRFAPDDSMRELARHILARTGGNPLFINEMIDSLIDRGILVADDGEPGPSGPSGPSRGLLRWVVRDAPLQVPATVEALLVTRIDQLPPVDKEALVCASVLGRRFSAALVEELIGQPASDSLDALVERGLLVRHGAQQLAFRNDLTMSAAYGLLPEDERAGLHRIAAQRLSESPSYRPGQDDALIARHLELAGDARLAADSYLRAAAHAVDVGGSQDAFRQLTRALKLLPATDHALRFAARCQREDVLRRLARRPAQLREIDAMRKEAEALADPVRLALVHSRLAQFYIDVRRLPSAVRAAEPALEHARRAGAPLAEAEALRLRAEIDRLSGQNAGALALCDQALALCSDDREGLHQRALILNTRGTALWNMARLHEGLDAYAESLVIYRMLKLARLEARALNNMGLVLAALGEAEEALAHYKSSLALDQELGDRAGVVLKLGNIGQCYADLGELERGERYLSKALKVSQEFGERTNTADVLVSLGQVSLQKRDLSRALELFERGLLQAREDNDRFQQIRALIYMCLAQLESGAPPERVFEAARSATEMAHQTQVPIAEVYGLAVQGLALARLGRAGEGAALTARAVALQREAEQPEGSEQILQFHARVCELAGRLDDARAALRDGQAEVERKAARLTDAELKATYLSAQVPSLIAEGYARLVAGAG